MATIACEQCGEIRTRCPKNTKLCVGCRNLRDTTYYGNTARDCADCAETFAPLYSRDLRCGACDYGRTDLRGHCAFCKQDDVYLVWRGYAVCKDCARAPKNRAKLIISLRRRQKERLAVPAEKRRSQWAAVVAKKKEQEAKLAAARAEAERLDAVEI